MATTTLDTLQLGNEHLVTKEYLDLKLNEIRVEFRNGLEKLELRMTIKTAVIVAAVIGFFRVIEAFF